MPINLSAVRSFLLQTDNDGDGVADPGDVFLHTLIITNSGDEDALNVEVDETEEGYEIDPGSVLIGPIAMDDVFSNVSGNTPITFTKAQLIGNDIDPDGAEANLTVVIDAGSAVNGTIVDNGNDTYTFTPTTGFEGNATFEYGLVDEDGVTSVEATPGLVTIEIDNLVWYVDSSSGSDATGDGSYAKPFATVNPLTTGGSADGLDGDGDIIFLYGGSAVSGNLVLEANQQLLGDSVALSVNGIAIGETTGNSDLNGSAGFTVTLAGGNEIDGIDIGGIGGITGTNFGILTVNNSTIDTSGQAIALNNGDILGNGFASTNSDGGTSNVSFVNVDGSLNLGSGALANATTGANVSVNGGDLSLTYNGTITQSQNASTVLVTNGHSGTLDFNGNVSATNGAGLQFNNADGTYRFDGAANSLTNTAGIDILNGSNGTFVFDNLFLNNSLLGDAFVLQGSNANVTINGTITDNNGRALNIDDHDGGTITINAAINSNSQGIWVTDSAGTINFNGPINLNTGTNNALTMTNNVGATFNFTPSGAGLDIVTTTGRGFFIEGGGTVSLVGASNTIATGTGRAVEIDGATIGNLGFTLLSVNMTGGGSTTGIFLNNAGTGGFAITGTGSVANSGGTIGTINGADGNVEQGIGIYLNNVSNVSLSNIQMTGTFSNYGIRGTNVNNFTLRDSLLTGTFGTNDSATLQEGTVSFGTQSSSTNGLTGTALFEGNVISNGFTNNLAVFNGGAGTLNMTVRDSASDQAVIGLNAINGNDGILVETRGNSVLVLEIDGVTFLGAKADMVQVIAAENTNQTLLIENNTFHNTHSATISGGGGITLSGGGATSNYDVVYTIQNNSFRGAEGSNMFITYAGQNADVSGRIINNTIGINDGVVSTTQATTGSRGGGAGIWVETQNTAGDGAVNHAVRIESNQIYDIISNSRGAIHVKANNFTNGTNRMEATILNNTISEGGEFLFTGINALVGGQGDGDTGRMGLDIRGNNINLGAFTGGGGGPDGNAIMLDQLSDDALFYIPGYSGSTQGEFPIAGSPGTASAGLSSFWTTSPRVNTLVNGQFPAFTSGGVDATIVEGLQNNAFVLPIPILAEHPGAEDWEAALGEQQEQAWEDHQDYLASLQAPGGGGDQGFGGDTKGDEKTPTPTPEEPADSGVYALTQAQLDAVVEAAIQRWAEAGATPEQIDAMRAATITVADMTGLYLASSGAGTIRIDNDGAGHGWFVDSTPGEDGEFSGSGNPLSADAGGPAAGHMDLLTVVMHELGHQVGLDDLYQSSDSDELMYGYAHLGERRLPEADDLIHADLDHPAHEAYTLTIPSVGTLPAGKAVRILYESTVNTFSNELIPIFQNFSTVRYEDSLSADFSITSANEATTIDTLTLGNLVFLDVNANGVFDAGDSGIEGVSLTLYHDTNGNGVYDDGTDLYVGYNEVNGTPGFQAGDDTPAAPGTGTALSVTTDVNGAYSFDSLAPGDYIVRATVSNFLSGGALNGLTVTATAADPDDNVDGDNNADGFTGYAATRTITLAYNTEPTNGTGNDTNNTLDLGFVQPNQPPVIANLDGNNVDYTENDGFTQVDLGDNVDITDPDSGDFDGGSLTVTVAGLAAGDELRFNSNVFIDTANGNEVEVGGVAIGTLTVLADGWRIDFNSEATPDRVETVVKAVEYRSTSEDPSGTRTFTWTLVDGDGTANGGDDDAAVTSTVTILAVNDEPAGDDATITIDEDATHTFAAAAFGFSDLDGDAFAGVVLTTLPAAGDLYLDGVAITVAGTFVTAADINANLLTYQPDPNGSGDDYATFTFQVRDDGGTDNGGVDTDQTPDTITIDVDPVNDAPTATNLGGDSVTWTEGDGAILLDSGSDALFADVDSTDFDTGSFTVAITGGFVSGEDVLGIDTSGNVTLSAGLTVGSNVSVSGTAVGQISAVSDDSVTIDLNANADPTDIDELARAFNYSNSGGDDPTDGNRTITWTLVDGDGVANGGTDTLNLTTTVDVDPVNDEPEGDDNTIVIDEDATHIFAAADFGFEDLLDDDAFAGVVITTLPVNGELTLNGSAFAAGTFVTAADIASGLLVFTPDPDGNGEPYATFTFQVRDDGGTDNGGQDTDQSADTITIDVTAVNDEPTLAATGNDPTFTEGDFPVNLFDGISVSTVETGQTFTSMTLTVTNVTDGLDERMNFDNSEIILTDGSSTTNNNGLSLNVSLSGTTATVTFSGASLSAAQLTTLIDELAYRNLSQDPTDADRVVTITELVDSGAGTSPDDNTAALNVASTVDVVPVNDAPQGTPNTVTASENGPAFVFTLADFGFSDTADGDGFQAVRIASLPAEGQLLLNGGAVSVGDFIDAADIAGGLLTFEPDLDEVGDPYTSFTFQVQDDGGTANGGVDLDATARTMTIDVTPDNLAPVAQDDDVATDEDAVLVGSVFDDNGNGADEDPDANETLVVAEVNGNAADVGTTTLLPSGALLAVNADGTFVYNPNGQFGYLITASLAATTGAVNDTFVDTFTYTLENGNTATVTVTIDGVESAGDELRGDSGDNVINGTAAGHFFRLDQGGDDTVTGLGGVDIFAFGDTFTELDNVDGGDGFDQLWLVGDYSSGVTFDPATLVNVEQILLGAGFSYGLWTDDANVAAGATLTVDGRGLGPLESLTFFGMDETNGRFILLGGGCDDLLVGGAGDDVLVGGAGNNLLAGEGGIDTLDYSAAPGAVDLDLSDGAYDNGYGGEDLYASDIENVIGTSFDDIIVGNAAANLLKGDGGIDDLSGAAGNDVLNGGIGADTMRGGADDDTYVVDDSGDIIVENAGQGTDRAFSSASYTLADHVEALWLTGNADIDGTGNGLANFIVGNDGDNVLNGKDGADIMKGDSGDDTYYVNDAGDRVVEVRPGDGFDRVFSSVSFTLGDHVETLRLNGNADVDGIGNALDNFIGGNSGNNLLNGKAGADIMKGYQGDDTYVVDNVGDQVVEVRPADGFDRVLSWVSFTLGSHVESLRLLGGAAMDGTGNELDNFIGGNAGANVLDGRAGADILKGEAGDDTYIVDNVGDQVIEYRADHGTDTVQSSIGYTLGRELENLTLTGSDAIDGTGNGMANTIIGNGAANFLDGKAGNDVLQGGGGGDTLRGALGNDVMEGGDGADQFLLDGPVGAANADTLLDFASGIDKILLENAFFTGLAAGPLSADAFTVGPAATTADHRIIYDPTSGALLFDADGSGAGAAVQFATLDNQPASLSASDFSVI